MRKTFIVIESISLIAIIYLFLTVSGVLVDAVIYSTQPRKPYEIVMLIIVFVITPLLMTVFVCQTLKLQINSINTHYKQPFFY